MKQHLINTLDALGYPVYLQGTAPEIYPDNFITFWTIDTPAAAEFDNALMLTEWQFYVYFYGTDPEHVQSAAETIRKALKAAGFNPQGKGRDLVSDEPTHTGWVQEFTILEEEKV